MVQWCRSDSSKPTNSYLNQRLEFQYTGGKLYENTPLHDTEQETPKFASVDFHEIPLMRSDIAMKYIISLTFTFQRNDE